MLTLGVCVHAGCADHRSPSLADRFMLHHRRSETHRQKAAPTPPSPTLEEAIGKVRRLMAEARPEPKSATQTLEAREPELAEALSTLHASPTAANFVDAADAYRTKGVLDQAYDNYMHALRLNPRQADAYEGLARVWRDWGLPRLGLGDAHRAVYYAPDRAAAQNTLGTLLQAVGRNKDARSAYKLAMMLDPTAGYPLSNLCYLSFVEGNATQAIAECRAAIRRDPQLAAAHNNLALTYATIGRLDLARSEFASGGGASAAAYNLGIVFLAQRRYSDAARQFDAASAGHPWFVEAARRAREAHRLVDRITDGPGGEQQ
jgi:tetratricopeptide (TPR) repeat protein